MREWMRREEASSLSNLRTELTLRRLNRFTPETLLICLFRDRLWSNMTLRFFAQSVAGISWPPIFSRKSFIWEIRWGFEITTNIETSIYFFVRTSPDEVFYSLQNFRLFHDLNVKPGKDATLFSVSWIDYYLRVLIRVVGYDQRITLHYQCKDTILTL